MSGLKRPESVLVVVHTPDATLVADRSCEESIREVVKRLEKSDWTEHL